MDAIEGVKLLRELRRTSEWVGDDQLGEKKSKEYRRLQDEAFNKLADHFCQHDWHDFCSGNKAKVIECKICSIRRVLDLLQEDKPK